MEIYKIGNDFSYKNITGIVEQEINQFSNFKGQELKHDWPIPKFDLLENITKVKVEKQPEQSKNNDFDARCYGNIFILKSNLMTLFEELNVEFLPVRLTDSNNDFSFVNVLTIIEAINFECKNYQQSMEMLKSNNIEFNKSNIADRHLFRDKKLINFYYCTSFFKELMDSNHIKGLSFERVGFAF